MQGSQVCSIWLPLDPIPLHSAVEYVAGSHRWQQQYQPYHFMDGSPYDGTGLPPLPDIEARRGELPIVRWAMEPGDVLAFHCDIVHGAPGHATASETEAGVQEQRRREQPGGGGLGWRRALVTRWLGDDARFAVKPGEVAIPTFDTGLRDGDRMDGRHFPRVL